MIQLPIYGAIKSIESKHQNYREIQHRNRHPTWMDDDHIVWYSLTSLERPQQPRQAGIKCQNWGIPGS